MVRAKARIHGLQLPKTVHQQSRAGHQDQRKAHLRDHQGSLYPVGSFSGGQPRSRSQALIHVHPRGAPSRKRSEKQSRRRRNGQRERHHAAIDADVRPARYRGPQEGPDYVNRP